MILLQIIFIYLRYLSLMIFFFSFYDYPKASNVLWESLHICLVLVLRPNKIPHLSLWKHTTNNKLLHFQHRCLGEFSSLWCSLWFYALAMHLQGAADRQIGRSGMMKIWEKVHENSLSRKPPREMSSCGLPWASRCEAKDSNGFRHCHAVMHMKGAHMKDVSSSFKMFFLLTGNNEKIWKNIENPLKRNQLFPATFSLFNRHFCRGYFHRNLLCRSQHSAAAEIPCRPCRRRDFKSPRAATRWKRC